MEAIGGRVCVHAPGEADRLERVASIWEASARIAAELAREGLEQQALA